MDRRTLNHLQYVLTSFLQSLRPTEICCMRLRSTTLALSLTSRSVCGNCPLHSAYVVLTWLQSYCNLVRFDNTFSEKNQYHTRRAMSIAPSFHSRRIVVFILDELFLHRVSGPVINWRDERQWAPQPEHRSPISESQHITFSGAIRCCIIPFECKLASRRATLECGRARER